LTYTYDAEAANQRDLAPGVKLRTLWGEKIMLSLVELAPNSQVPMHDHPHEQAGMVLEGEFDFTIGGETTRMKKGDFYIIPGGVEHGLVSGDGWSSALDIFSPPREEYKT
jgi:quercetin dioxygenase-like cupin family protein